MGLKLSNNALTTLYQSIGASDTVLQVAPNKGDGFPVLPGNATDFCVITMEDASGNREFIRCDQRQSGSDILGSVSFPLQRGYWGSSARSWAAGDSVDLRLSADAVEELIGQTVTQDDAALNALIWG